MLGYDQALHNGRRITVLSGFAALSTVVQEKATEKSVAFYRSWPLHPKGGIANVFQDYIPCSAEVFRLDHGA